MPFVEYVRRGQRAQRNAEFSMDTLDSILMQILANANGLYAPVSLRRLCYKLFLLHPAPSGYPIFQLPLLQFRVDRSTLSESGTHALCEKRTVCKEQPREMLV